MLASLQRTSTLGLHRLNNQLHSPFQRRIRSFYYEDIDKEEIGAGSNVPEDDGDDERD